MPALDPEERLAVGIAGELCPAPQPQTRLAHRAGRDHVGWIAPDRKAAVRGARAAGPQRASRDRRTAPAGSGARRPHRRRHKGASAVAARGSRDSGAPCRHWIRARSRARSNRPRPQVRRLRRWLRLARRLTAPRPRAGSHPRRRRASRPQAPALRAGSPSGARAPSCRHPIPGP